MEVARQLVPRFIFLTISILNHLPYVSWTNAYEGHREVIEAATLGGSSTPNSPIGLLIAIWEGR